MTNFLCKYCGSQFATSALLTKGVCQKNSEGNHHVLYEGDEKTVYVCMFCKSKYATILNLTLGICKKNPTGKFHIPAI